MYMQYRATRYIKRVAPFVVPALMAKLVDALDLGSSGFGRVGSSPTGGTILINFIMNKDVIVIRRKGHDVYVTPMKVKNLDKSKCSNKFLQKLGVTISEEDTVYVKCFIDGNIDFRGKREEYRILPEKEVQ